MIVRAPMLRPAAARGCRNFTDQGIFRLARFAIGLVTDQTGRRHFVP
jgi:hypothetical protein